LQAREAAIAVQGKMVDLQRKKGKGLWLGVASVFWDCVSVEKLDNYDLQNEWHCNLKRSSSALKTEDCFRFAALCYCPTSKL
jgi:hypothetical protein